MLSTFRQRTCWSLPRYLPRYARPITTEFNPQRAEALDILGLGEDLGPSTTAATEAVPRPSVDLDNMHHHIPPAQSPLLQFMTTMLMRDGKYAKAAKTTSKMLLHIYALTRSPPMPIVEKAIEILSPAVRSRRMKAGGGKTVYVPQALNERQRTRRGIKWLIDEVDKPGKPGGTLAERMARQVLATVNGHDGTHRLKEDVHKLAMVNRGVLPKR
ncbi:ribosomal protein S7 domain-containing protein [Crepidotus variabilis]|uniref:Ribosomal protein S7 domain-containing protein n=1 Tax=Crepidotus variabilis TaxID=179855 RepID=A0A9P6EFY3_9AGAR|nr:ribosomal protein S7 domain-containing protein [Crepidotus variabilis]